MKCTVTLGYHGTIHVRGVTSDGKPSGVFQPGRRTFTGAKHRNGANMCLTASTVQRYLGTKLLVRGHKAHVDDKGLFNRIDPVDIYHYGRKCYGIITVPLKTLSQFAKLMEAKS